jgi:hypothetical protein
MDLNKFFNYFNPTSDDDDEVLSKNLESFKESPIYKIKVFERLILNGLLFKKSIINFFSQADESLDMIQVDLAGEFMMYNRAWFWISQVDWNDGQWVKDLEIASNENLLTAVKLCMHYFEEQEEYEKCAFLKKIQDFVQNCLAIED